MRTEEVKKEVIINNGLWELAYDQWAALPVTGRQPAPRYKHTAAVVDAKLYIVGGSRTGRYLSDVQVFDLKSLSWSNLKLQIDPDSHESEDNGSQEVLLATSGHNMVKWGNKFLLIGGNSKRSSDKILVRFINLETQTCGVMKTSGKVPVARAGQSATLVGSRLIIFGGEDRSRRLLNDLHVLRLDTMTWEEVEKTKNSPPAPRFDHTAAVLGENYLLIFGGCSHSVFFSDLHLLDFQTMEWSQPHVQGDLVTPRAGHAGLAIDENWYIVGGGDNRNGCPQTIMLDMSKLVWSELTTVKQRDPLASEGLSVCMAIIEGEKHLVAFGGYNGNYSNEVFLMKPKPKDSSRPKIFQSPAAAAAAASVTAAYALAKSTSKGTVNNISQEPLIYFIEAIRKEKTVLEASLTEVRTGNAKLQGQIDEVNSTHTELSKELQSVQGQLVAERSRCFKLEAQIVELQKKLESVQTIEKEVQLLRRQKSALDRDMELASSVQKQGSGGLWRWMSGSTNEA